MITVKVRRGNDPNRALNNALKTLKDCIYSSKLNKELQKHREYIKPSDRRRAKHARAVYGQQVRQAMIERDLNR